MTLAASSITHRFGKTAALSGVTLAAHRGQITVLIGPNAAGKSTLLRCLSGALDPIEGTITFDGKPLAHLRRSQRAPRIAFVPQRPGVGAAFCVREVVELGRYLLRPDHRRIAQAVERMQIENLLQRPFNELSVGQQQRVTIARALAQVDSTGFLVLDEPTAAMDIRHNLQTIAVLREFARQGGGVILSMHDLSQAATSADIVGILNQGKLVESGSPRQVMQPASMQSVFGAEFSWHSSSFCESLLIRPLM